MDLLNLVDNMSDEMYQRLKSAAETGKWPEGTPVDQAQRESALQITMAYQSRHLNLDEMLTVGSDGHMVTKTKRELKAQFSKTQPAKTNISTNDDTNNIARFSNL
jgi:uncharacterized protein YeaC (DUF1315 family)